MRWESLLCAQSAGFLCAVFDGQQLNLTMQRRRVATRYAVVVDPPPVGRGHFIDHEVTSALCRDYEERSRCHRQRGASGASFHTRAWHRAGDRPPICSRRPAIQRDGGARRQCA